MNGGDQALSDYPEDYVLEELGAFNSETRKGYFSETHTALACGTDLKDTTTPPALMDTTPQTDNPEQVAHIINQALAAQGQR